MFSIAVPRVRSGCLALLALCALPFAHAQQYGIRTVAGGGPNNVVATAASLSAPYGVAVDGSGNTYVSAMLRHQVYRITPGGTLTVYAGTGNYGFSGDGGPATGAALSYPMGLALDPNGNLYVADSNNNRIRKIDATTGVITTVVGGGQSLNGDGGPATSATLSGPSNVIFESNGTMYISDTNNNRVRRVDPSTNVITTYAGGYTCCFGDLGDGGQAFGAKLSGPEGLALDSSNNLYIADTGYYRVRKVTKATGVITTVAGSAIGQNTGDGGLATSATLHTPVGVAVNANGDLFIGVVQAVRKVTGTTISKVAGAAGAYPNVFGLPASDASIGNGGPALDAKLTKPKQLTLDGSGNVVFADSEFGRVRKISGTTILAVAGNGWYHYSGDGGPASRASLNTARDLAFHSTGDLLISDQGNNAIRRVNSLGDISTFAGNGLGGASAVIGDGGLLADARINAPRGLSNAGGRFVVTDPNNYRLREVISNVITTIAGTGFSGGVSGTGDGTATSVGLNGVYGAVADPFGNVFITDENRVRVVANGKIITIAGSTTCGSSGDNGPAINARLCQVRGIARDSSGHLYVADTGFHKIRKITGVPSGLIGDSGCPACSITTIAGTGSYGFSGDGGPATSAQLFAAEGVAVDSDDNIYIADTGNNRIRKISGGTISTIAGNGTKGFSNDGYLATNAMLAAPTAVLVDSATGTVYVADSENHRVRSLSPGVVSVTVTSSPAGRTVYVDGTPYTAPQTFSWATGSTHTIAALQHGSNGTQYLFSSWSDNGSATHTVAPNSPTTYTANFSTQYYLTTTSNQPAMGSISPASGWYNSGAVVSVSATANAGYALTGFSGSLSGTTNPQSLNMNGPKTVSASFALLTTTVTTSPAGLAIVVDGVNHVSPKTFQWTPGTNHTISVQTQISGGPGTRYQFQNWSDAGSAAHTVVAPSQPTTFTANFQTQYALTTAVSPAAAGTVTAGGWHAANSNVAITATANAGYTFANFSGFVGGPTPANPLNLTMDGPKNVVANFTSQAAALSASLANKSWNAGTQTETVTINLANTGLSNAVNAQITSIVATVFQGSGVLGAPNPASQVLGTIAPGGSATSAAITIPTPGTVIRLKLVVNYQADGGVAGSTQLIFFK